jgi:hypothetical protein
LLKFDTFNNLKILYMHDNQITSIIIAETNI